MFFYRAPAQMATPSMVLSSMLATTQASEACHLAETAAGLPVRLPAARLHVQAAVWLPAQAALCLVPPS